ncbi:MAG: PH domain-containing protein [Pirellulaceae bacterium]|nr:PH domain-containing protein [Pirellulaceae bacterium]
MKCYACGAEANDSAVFCDKCGARLDEAPAAEAASTAEQPPQASQEPRSAADKLRQAAGGRNHDVSDEVLWEGGYSAQGMIGTWLLAGIGSVVLLVAAVALFVTTGPVGLIPLVALAVLWIVLGCILAYHKLSVSYSLTSQRFLHRSGILRQVTDRIEVIDMDDVSFEQGLLQRMVGVGTIHIVSSDRSHPELTLHGIADVKHVAELMDDTRRAERRRRGLHIESI